MKIVATGVKHSSYNKHALSCQVNACQIERNVMRSAETTQTGNRGEVLGGSRPEQADASWRRTIGPSASASNHMAYKQESCTMTKGANAKVSAGKVIHAQPTME